MATDFVGLDRNISTFDLIEAVEFLGHDPHKVASIQMVSGALEVREIHRHEMAPSSAIQYEYVRVGNGFLCDTRLIPFSDIEMFVAELGYFVETVHEISISPETIKVTSIEEHQFNTEYFTRNLTGTLKDD